jgi:hypothetical protein
MPVLRRKGCTAVPCVQEGRRALEASERDVVGIIMAAGTLAALRSVMSNTLRCLLAAGALAIASAGFGPCEPEAGTVTIDTLPRPAPPEVHATRASAPQRTRTVDDAAARLGDRAALVGADGALRRGLVEWGSGARVVTWDAE